MRKGKKKGRKKGGKGNNLPIGGCLRNPPTDRPSRVRRIYMPGRRVIISFFWSAASLPPPLQLPLLLLLFHVTTQHNLVLYTISRCATCNIQHTTHSSREACGAPHGFAEDHRSGTGVYKCPAATGSHVASYHSHT